MDRKRPRYPMRSVEEATWRSVIWRKYGLTVKDYAYMANEQGLKCATCATRLDLDSKDTHIDHCHATNRVRGLLCVRCNLALGFARDNASVLRTMAMYIDHHT